MTGLADVLFLAYVTLNGIDYVFRSAIEGLKERVALDLSEW